jgi:hypothetical protein
MAEIKTLTLKNRSNCIIKTINSKAKPNYNSSRGTEIEEVAVDALESVHF